MKLFLELGNRYAKQSDWKDFALVKFCLFAMGVLAGTQVKPERKKPVSAAALGVFLVTYIPLMTKVFRIGTEMLSARKADEKNQMEQEKK